MSGKLGPLTGTGTQIVVIGIAIMVAGTAGIVWWTVLALPFAGKLGDASPACFFGACIPIDLYRMLSAAYVLITISGIGLVIVGGRLREVARRVRAGDTIP